MSVLAAVDFSDRTTRYPKSIQEVPTEPAKNGLFVLKPGYHNKKLGARLTKSHWKGFPLFALTLVERTTCWAGCQNIDRCYGDSMPFAHRFKHGPELEVAIERDVAELSSNMRGFAVRLHVLGDFYSVEYVEHWHRLLQEYEPLRLWGYTHHRWRSPIGRAVTELVERNPGRAYFLRSDADEPGDPLPPAMTVERGADALPGTVICPEQTGKTTSCGTCGLCMNGRTGITFVDHSRLLKTASKPIFI